MQINIKEIKYAFHWLKNNEKMPCTVELEIGEFRIKGFRIMASNFEDERFTLYPPANRMSNGKWIDLFWTDNKELWSDLKKEILKEFESEHTKHYIEEEFKEHII